MLLLTRASLITRFAALSLMLGSLNPALAQVKPTPKDSAEKYENPGGIPAAVKAPWYRSKLVKAVAIPAAHNLA